MGKEVLFELFDPKENYGTLILFYGGQHYKESEKRQARDRVNELFKLSRSIRGVYSNFMVLVEGTESGGLLVADALVHPNYDEMAKEEVALIQVTALGEKLGPDVVHPVSFGIDMPFAERLRNFSMEDGALLILSTAMRDATEDTSLWQFLRHYDRYKQKIEEYFQLEEYIQPILENLEMDVKEDEIESYRRKIRNIFDTSLAESTDVFRREYGPRMRKVEKKESDMRERHMAREIIENIESVGGAIFYIVIGQDHLKPIIKILTQLFHDHGMIFRKLASGRKVRESVFVKYKKRAAQWYGKAR